jgi:hypothetical protein
MWNVTKTGYQSSMMPMSETELQQMERHERQLGGELLL